MKKLFFCLTLFTIVVLKGFAQIDFELNTSHGKCRITVYTDLKDTVVYYGGSHVYEKEVEYRERFVQKGVLEKASLPRSLIDDIINYVKSEYFWNHFVRINIDFPFSGPTRVGSRFYYTYNYFMLIDATGNNYVIYGCQ